ncbi:MAG TPA: hypothetical protein VNO21_18725 [Polyangiaceae bacterium]|nr:hypothetical protein [Polyangiaceae bacterium]
MATTAKVSLTMDLHTLHLAKTAAERTGVSLSSLVSAALERHMTSVVEELEQRGAPEQVIATFPPEHLPNAQEQEEILASWSKASIPPTKGEIESVFEGRAKETGRPPSRRR